MVGLGSMAARLMLACVAVSGCAPVAGRLAPAIPASSSIMAIMAAASPVMTALYAVIRGCMMCKYINGCFDFGSCCGLIGFRGCYAMGLNIYKCF